MTGFGAASRELSGGTLSVELKSVNHRHLNISFRLPPGADIWEQQLRARLARRVRRGHVGFLIAVDAAPEGEGDWQVDHGRVRATLEAIRTLQDKYGIPGEIDLGTLLMATREVLRDERSDDLGWVDAEALNEVVEEAIDELIRMRELEGGRLEKDLRETIGQVAAAVDTIQSLAPRRLTRERDRLRAAARELTDGLRLDEDRLEQEIALLADKWDIGEEVVRARAHVAAFEELLDADADEPVGKRLSFVLQELNREVNTVGSKANDTTISGRVVEAKNALERLREQVENIE
jgi:uncharacterized protein (TIGR00255 family)